MKKSEKELYGKIAELRCSLCRYLGLGETECEIHHIRRFGGKREKNETYQENAIREMVEELFNVPHVIHTLIINIKKVVPLKTLYYNDYYILVYTFDDLLTIYFYRLVHICVYNL